MERETKEIVTPIGKHKVVLYEWLTGRERRNIRSVLLEGINFEQSPDNEEASPGYNIQGSIINKAQDKSFESVIKSIDGKTEGIADIVLDMRDEDFDFIVLEVDKITTSIDKEAKKK